MSFSIPEVGKLRSKCAGNSIVSPIPVDFTDAFVIEFDGRLVIRSLSKG
jgi:hypothetical protein